MPRQSPRSFPPRAQVRRKGQDWLIRVLAGNEEIDGARSESLAEARRWLSKKYPAANVEVLSEPAAARGSKDLVIERWSGRRPPARDLHDMTQREIERLIFPPDLPTHKHVGLRDALTDAEILHLPEHPAWGDFSRAFQDRVWSTIEAIDDGDAQGRTRNAPRNKSRARDAVERYAIDEERDRRSGSLTYTVRVADEHYDRLSAERDTEALDMLRQDYPSEFVAQQEAESVFRNASQYED